ncbi:MAG: PIN domain-containing protein [Capsulimonas sp.]|uniref:PIN domain-containing protein n=1 Tax=Capsulimonas sp. TaxID=2494211 RepID=UPI00326652DF
MILAVLDACVLYPQSLRDLLMRVAVVGAYEPRLTDEIHAEWIRNVLADRPELNPAHLERTRQLMSLITPKCLVSGYEAHIPTISLPDANDRHVVAAAMEAKAPVIVTFNLSDFPAPTLLAYGVMPVHPDMFLSALFDENSALFLHAVQVHRASLKNPPKSVEDYIQTLRVNGLKELAVRVEAGAAAI